MEVVVGLISLRTAWAEEIVGVAVGLAGLKMKISFLDGNIILNKPLHAAVLPPFKNEQTPQNTYLITQLHQYILLLKTLNIPPPLISCLGGPKSLKS
jgi:hypothetical protein